MSNEDSFLVVLPRGFRQCAIFWPPPLGRALRCYSSPRGTVPLVHRGASSGRSLRPAEPCASVLWGIRYGHWRGFRSPQTSRFSTLPTQTNDPLVFASELLTIRVDYFLPFWKSLARRNTKSGVPRFSLISVFWQCWKLLEIVKKCSLVFATITH
jgi:hypothetical protein